MYYIKALVGKDPATNSYRISTIFHLFHYYSRIIPNIHEVIISLSDGSMEDQPWPLWLDVVIELSHLSLSISCSLNFYIYIFKYKAIKNQGDLETTAANTMIQQTEASSRCVTKFWKDTFLVKFFKYYQYQIIKNIQWQLCRYSTRNK